MKFLPYILKNIKRHKLRSVFTVLSIAVSLFLVTMLYAYLEFQDELGRKSVAFNRLAVTHVQGLTALMPVTTLDKIRKIPGVKAAMPMSWFGGIYKDDRLAFAQFGTDARECMKVWEEYSLEPDQLKAWQEDKTGCVIGWRLASKRKWNIGDKLPLKGTIYPCDLEFTVRGIYHGPETADPEMLWFHREYLDEMLKNRRSRAAGMIGMVMVKAASASALPDLSRAIDAKFASSNEPVRAMTEQAFQHMFTEMVGNVQAFVRNTALAVVFSLVCVAGNAMAMSLRERTREVAVLKAIGFQRGTVLGMVLGEAVFIAMIGGLVGAVGGKLLFDFTDPGISGLPGLSRFYVPWNSALLGVGLSGAVGLASGILPAWRAARMSVVDGLRRVV